MANILVTGATGFVGSHIVETLLEKKHKIFCFVRKSSNLKWIKNLGVEYKIGDFIDVKFLKSVVKNMDFIVHCAGVVRANSQKEYFEINVENTKNLCESVLSSNPCLKKFIFISSQAAMGPSTESIRKIADAENPVSDYGFSKLYAEKQIKKIFFEKIPYTIFRPASVYGPRDKDIFIFFNLVHKHLRPFTTTKRLLQLVFVKDIANAVSNAMENQNTINKTYYLAEKSIYSWEDIARIISTCSNRKTFPLPLPDFIFKIAGFIAQIVSHISKSPAVLNHQKITEMLQSSWTADTSSSQSDLNVNFTSFELGAKITYNWYIDNKYF
ncbi:MAG: NAD-dependent epimerase/dehydratase family protein [Elusimicrobiota bacterium]|nr:NAD-dependent epimerase/dehydratase family protein [Elusimicrobiota bacterium]